MLQHPFGVIRAPDPVQDDGREAPECRHADRAESGGFECPPHPAGLHVEQAPLDDLLPKCLSSGVSIVVGGPLNSGILAGRDTWNYKAAPPEVVARVDVIRRVCDRHQVPLAAAALQFPLAHPAVAAIIPGPRSVPEFEANLRLLRYPIPAALWADLRDAKLLHPDAPTPT